MTRTIHMLPDFERSLDRLVETGRYGDANDVVMYAIAALEDQDAARDAREARLQAMIREGIADAEAGRLHDVDEVFAELDAIIDGHDSPQAAAE